MPRYYKDRIYTTGERLAIAKAMAKQGYTIPDLMVTGASKIDLHRAIAHANSQVYIEAEKNNYL